MCCTPAPVLAICIMPVPAHSLLTCRRLHHASVHLQQQQQQQQLLPQLRLLKLPPANMLQVMQGQQCQCSGRAVQGQGQHILRLQLVLARSCTMPWMWHHLLSRRVGHCLLYQQLCMCVMQVACRRDCSTLHIIPPHLPHTQALILGPPLSVAHHTACLQRGSPMLSMALRRGSAVRMRGASWHAWLR
jgi:hypothetical protein